MRIFSVMLLTSILAVVIVNSLCCAEFTCCSLFTCYVVVGYLDWLCAQIGYFGDKCFPRKQINGLVTGVTWMAVSVSLFEDKELEMKLFFYVESHWGFNTVFKKGKCYVQPLKAIIFQRTHWPFSDVSLVLNTYTHTKKKRIKKKNRKWQSPFWLRICLIFQIYYLYALHILQKRVHRMKSSYFCLPNFKLFPLQCVLEHA